MSANAAKNTHEVVLRELLAHASPGTVVDVPCGSGSLARRIADSGFKVIGLDLETPAEPGPFEFRRADLNEALPLADGAVDCVVSVEGIEHLERPFELVRECRRVLASRGLLLITTPNISSLRSRWRWFLTGHHNKCKYTLDETDYPNPMHHINMLAYHELRYMLHTNGFRIESVTTNRIKPMNWLYLPVVPIVWLVSRLVIAAATDREINRGLNLEVFREMMQPALLFGEIMIVVARKTDARGMPTPSAEPAA